MDRDPNAHFTSISFGECQVCRMPAGDHVRVRLHPYAPEGEVVPDYGDGRIRHHVARLPERDPREWFPPDVVRSDPVQRRMPSGEVTEVR